MTKQLLLRIHHPSRGSFPQSMRWDVAFHTCERPAFLVGTLVNAAKEKTKGAQEGHWLFLKKRAEALKAKDPRESARLYELAGDVQLAAMDPRNPGQCQNDSQSVSGCYSNAAGLKKESDPGDAFRLFRLAGDVARYCFNSGLTDMYYSDASSLAISKDKKAEITERHGDLFHEFGIGNSAMSKAYDKKNAIRIYRSAITKYRQVQEMLGSGDESKKQLLEAKIAHCYIGAEKVREELFQEYGRGK